jgi:hypothetical protein
MLVIGFRVRLFKLKGDFMSKKMMFILSFFLFYYSCSDDNLVDHPEPVAYTNIQGKLTSDLKYTDSPYRVVNSLFIDSLETIFIEAGVEMYFADSCILQINGKLIAQGQKNKPILFTAINEKWKGIRLFNSGNNSTFQFIVLQNAEVNSVDSSSFGVIEINNSSANISNCIIQKNSAPHGGGIAIVNSSASIYNNIFRDNQAVAYGGAIFSYNSKTKIINNTFYKNYSHNHGGALTLYKSKKDSIQNNIFYQNISRFGDPRVSIVNSDNSTYYLGIIFCLLPHQVQNSIQIPI